MPFEIVIVFVAVFGLVVGSFLNVVIYRIPLIFDYDAEPEPEPEVEPQTWWRALSSEIRGFFPDLWALLRVTAKDYVTLFRGNARGVSLAKPDSRCPRCGTPIRWYLNIPIVSWLALRGKCVKCKVHIPARYPAVELLTGVLAVAVLFQHGFTPWALFQFLFVASLVAITFIDLDYMLIPDVISLPGIAIGLAGQALVPGGDVSQALLAVAVGGGSFWLIATAFAVLRGVEGMGGGDIKLLAMIGAFTSPFGVLQTVLVGSLIGSVVGMIYLAATRKGGQTPIPFGPFLAFGGLTASLFPTILKDLLLAGVQP